LVAVFPLSILELRDKTATVKLPDGQRLLAKQDWYNKETFAGERELTWQLVCKTPVKDSTHKTWDEQQALLTTDDETPTSYVMVYTIISHFLATTERLFEKVYVRTSSVRSFDVRVSVGGFDSRGLDVSNAGSDGLRDGPLGVASARKSN
ncbi:MAG: hypothetical protein WC797_04505, partial [Candidatus Paceibacterota bacterium]